MQPSTVAIIITVIAIVLYVTEIIPLPVTAVSACLLMGICGVTTYARSFSGFSNDILMMSAGMIIVGDTLFATGAARLIGTRIVRLFGRSERLFIGATVLITATLSAFLSNTATAAMMIPVMASAVAASNGRLSKRNTYMAVGFASIAGGGCTLIGSTPQLLAQGILEEGGYPACGFFDYAAAGIPKVLILLAYFLTVGYWLGKRVFDFEESQDPIPANSGGEEQSERLTPKMLISILILCGCVLGFILGLWTLGTVAMLGAVLCVVTRCVDLKELFRNLDWGTIVLVAGSIGFANCLDDSGAGQVIAGAIMNLVGRSVPPLLLFAIFGLLAVIAGNIMTHTATAAILLPIIVFIAGDIGFDPRAAAMIVVIFTNVTYSTPIMTPAATLTLQAGYRFRDYIKVGGLLNVISYLATVALLPLLFEF